MPRGTRSRATEEEENRERPSTKQMSLKTNRIHTKVEVMRLHLEQDNLNVEIQTCTAILSNLEGTAVKKSVVAKREYERDTADKLFQNLLNRFGSGMKGASSHDEI